MVNKNINLEQPQKLLVLAPQLTKLGTGTFSQELNSPQYEARESSFNRCRNLLTVSGLLEANSFYLRAIYPACKKLTFLNLCDATLRSDDLKKASNIDAGNSKDGNAGDIDGVQEANKVLKDGVLSHEVQPGEKLPGESHLHEILELLHAPQFQVLQSEYPLSEKLQLAQKDQKSAVDLLQHIQMVRKVLTLASKEEQSAYLSTWARIAAVCAEELAHGSLIWKQAFENNVHGQLMSDTRGQRHIQALGEIYRVVQLLGSSAKLYKPWILLNSDNVIDLIPLLDECTTLWSDSGLEERLENLSDVVETKNCILIEGLLESIKHIRNIDVLSMLDLDFTAPASFCQMTLLPLEILSGLEAVLWNESLYFLSVANLWANLVSSEPPQLTRLCG